MNKVILTGNLTRDPEPKVIDGKGGKQVTVVNFSIATSRYFPKADGSRGEETTFIDCEAWDSGAETIAKHLKKGSRVLIEGALKSDKWEDNDGNKRSKLKIRVNNFEFLNTKKKEEGAVDNSTSAENQDVPVAAGVGGDDSQPF